jgi:ubiquinone biosynthesis protein COQ4
MQLVRLAKPLYFYFRLARDPSQLDSVFQMRDAADDPRVSRAVYDRLSQEPEAREAFATRPRLGHFTIKELLAMPAGSLGREYGEFMERHGLTPDAIPRVEADDGPRYMRAHLYETHDLWHVLTGFPPDTEGETGLQAFYAAQLPGMLHAALVSALLLNAAIERSSRKSKERFDAVARGWDMGTRAKLFFGYRWRDNFERPLADVRRDLGVDPSLARPRPLRTVLETDLS